MSDIKDEELIQEFLKILNGIQSNLTESLASMFAGFQIEKFDLSLVNSRDLITSLEGKKIHVRVDVTGDLQAYHAYFFEEGIAFALESMMQMDSKNMDDEGLHSLIQEMASTFDSGIYTNVAEFSSLLGDVLTKN